MGRLPILRTELLSYTIKAFGDRITWSEVLAPLSSDFMTPDSILWEFLKERVYSNNPKILEDRKDNTEEYFIGADQQLFDMWQEIL
jgi:hypothetical protein